MRMRSVIRFLILFGWLTPAVGAWAQAGGDFDLRARIGGEFRSNISRQPGVFRERDFRAAVAVSAARKWRFGSGQRLGLSYELQHYRYQEFGDFTRYDQTVLLNYSLDLGKKYRFSLSEEPKLRLQPETKRLNYIRNIFGLSLKRKLGPGRDLSLGYQHRVKSYPNDASLTRYLSHRTYVKYDRTLPGKASLGARLEYQSHKGHLYYWSTAPEQDLNVRGDRLLLRLSLDKIVSARIVANASYKFELDYADDVGVDEEPDGFDDEDIEEADDSDFGYAKHQLAVSWLYKPRPRLSLLFFYLGQRKSFEYWRIDPNGLTGPLRLDYLFLMSHRLRFELSQLVTDLESDRDQLPVILGRRRQRQENEILAVGKPRDDLVRHLAVSKLGEVLFDVLHLEGAVLEAVLPDDVFHEPRSETHRLARSEGLLRSRGGKSPISGRPESAGASAPPGPRWTSCAKAPEWFPRPPQSFPGRTE